MVNGFTSQFTTTVTTSPFGRSPMWRRLAKSTLTMIGKTIAQMRTATTRFTE